VFTTRFPSPTGVEPPPAAAPGVVLRAPVPNPARGSAVMAFDLPRDADVSMRLHDVAGRELAVLARGPHARGTHFARIDTARLAPGVYLCTLAVDGARQTRRLTVVR
jgi:hypothetical protein